MPNTPSPAYKYGSSIVISESPEIRPAINDNWQARRELADALRRLNAAALTADASSALLRATAAIVNAEAARIEENPRVYGREALRRLVPPQQQTADLRYETNPASGLSNAVAPHMNIWREGERAHARVTLDWSHEGPSGHVHGGVVAMLFDQFLGLAQCLAGNIGHTGTLTIRYHHLTPLNQTLNLVAELKRVEGRKNFMAAEIWAGDVRTASCEGVFITRKVPLPPVSDKAKT
ncbi:MAG: PaaI family thioesterase [Georgfuchsia sp.]